MAISILVRLINILSQFLILLVIVKVILSYFMDPYHPLRRTLDNLVEPLLAPIRRVVPLIGMFDFSPLILIILVQVLSSVLISFLYTLR
ncbi:MAG: YggT family protein [Anaerolineales bacterium]|jgi:YggT family protein|nr:YggT family protein [Anaerolineales bacterium]